MNIKAHFLTSINLTNGPPVCELSDLHVEGRRLEAAVVLPDREDVVGAVGEGLGVVRAVGAGVAGVVVIVAPR